MPSIARRAIAEMIGTGALIFFGCSAVVMNAYPTGRYGIFGIAMVHAVVLSLAISMTMGTSGGNLNPAVTIGLASIGRISVRDAVVYVLAQLAGAVLAALLMQAVIPAYAARLVAWGTPMLNGQITFNQACALEAIFTFLLMSAVMGTVVSGKAPKIGGFGVGLTLIPSIMVGGDLTGAAANPARAFGPAIVSGTMTSQMVWWIGPIVGGVAAALLWQHVILKDEG